eukprot:gene24184-9778_t
MLVPAESNFPEGNPFACVQMSASNILVRGYMNNSDESAVMSRAILMQRYSASLTVVLKLRCEEVDNLAIRSSCLALPMWVGQRPGNYSNEPTDFTLNLEGFFNQCGIMNAPAPASPPPPKPIQFAGTCTMRLTLYSDAIKSAQLWSCIQYAKILDSLFAGDAAAVQAPLLGEESQDAFISLLQNHLPAVVSFGRALYGSACNDVMTFNPGCGMADSFNVTWDDSYSPSCSEVAGA